MALFPGDSRVTLGRARARTGTSAYSCLPIWLYRRYAAQYHLATVAAEVPELRLLLNDLVAPWGAAALWLRTTCLDPPSYQYATSSQGYLGGLMDPLHKKSKLAGLPSVLITLSSPRTLCSLVQICSHSDHCKTLEWNISPCSLSLSSKE